MFTHQPCNFNSIFDFPTSRRCVLFPRCWWNQWDSSPIHHRYSNTNSMWVHVIIWSQWCHFYVCHIWHKWHEIPSIHLDGFDDHRTCVHLDWIITRRQTIEDLIEWLKPLKDKMLSRMPHWKPSCFFVDDAPQELALRLVLYLVLTLCLFL
jgi:hypothetical protein